MISVREVQRARERIAGRFVRTPVLSAPGLDYPNLHLKAELFQRTGSFKIRGVTNKLLAMPPAARDGGLVSISAGNFAAALAFVATTLGASATIVMPATASRWKIDATRAYGGDVILTEGSLMETCSQVQRERGLTFVHPFDDVEVMAGHGTIGLEILEDLPDVDAVIVPVGGGGLIGGIAAAMPGVDVYGVEPEGADAMSQSLAAGKPVHIKPQTIADGLAAPFAGEHTLAHVQGLVKSVVRVKDDDIVTALRLLVTKYKLAAEPSGAAALAALTSGALALDRDARVLCVVSGGNVDPELLKEIL